MTDPCSMIAPGAYTGPASCAIPSPGGYPGPTGPNNTSSGGGNAGAGAPGNPQTLPKGKQQKRCQDAYNNSPIGKTIQLASPLQMIPGWGAHPTESATETGVGITGKAAVLQETAGTAGQPAIQSIFSDAWNLAGPVEEFVGAAATKLLGLAEVGAPVVWIAGAVADVQVHAACAGYYSNMGGPMGLPTGYF